MFRPKSDSTFASAARTGQGRPQVAAAACSTASWSGGISSTRAPAMGPARRSPRPSWHLVHPRAGDGVARCGRAQEGHQARDGEGEGEDDGEHEAGDHFERVAAEAGEHEREERLLHHAPPLARPPKRLSSTRAPWRYTT